MFPIGLGVYPNADINLVIKAVPEHTPILIMDNYNKGFVLGLQNYICIKRVFKADPQIDYTLTPEQNAQNWFLYLTNDSNFNLYKYCVGWNEVFSDKSKYQFIADCEVALCNKLLSVGMKYLWGSINVGNIEASDMVTTFKEINSIADGINYHGYLSPGDYHVNYDTNMDYVKRPYKWYQACLSAGVRFPPLFFGESGTYYPWIGSLTTRNYVSVLKEISELLNQWQQMGMEILGHNAFAIGAEGTMGDQWNITDVSDIQVYNNSLPVVVPIQPTYINRNGAWIWYVNFSPNLLSDLKRTNLNWVTVKWSDGTSYGDEVNSTVFKDQFTTNLQLLHNAGLKVYSDSYIYLNDPVQEANVVAQAIKAGADGVVLDAEYECINKFVQAQLFFDTLLKLVPEGTLISYSPDFRILEGNTVLPWHSNLNAEPWPWEVFNKYCQYVMPQLYWTDFQVMPAVTFDLIDIYLQNFPNGPKIVPVFPSNCTGAELQVALNYCDKYQISGCSMWRFDDITPAISQVLNNKEWILNFTTEEFLAIGKEIFSFTNVPFNPDAALIKAWIASWKAGKYLGEPVGSEFVAGRFTCQQFMNDICWAETGNWGNFGTGAK